MSKENNSQTQGVPMCSEQAVLHALDMARSETHKQGDAALWQAFGRAMWRQFNAMLSAAPQAQPVEVGDYESRYIQHTVKKQGAVLCNDAYTRYESSKCLIVEMDLHSKYCELVGSSGYGVFVAANERSLHLDDTLPRDVYTWIEFDLPPGKWEFVTGDVSRYTMTCVFLRYI